jgi:penicillin-binding protein 1A
MVARFGNAAQTAGLRVTTTIDSRLQAAANRAMRENLLAYDERHGYRGPLARVELPEGANAEGPLAPEAVETLRLLLDDHGPLLDQQSAIVLAADDVSARYSFADYGEQSLA